MHLFLCYQGEHYSPPRHGTLEHKSCSVSINSFSIQSLSRQLRDPDVSDVFVPAQIVCQLLFPYQCCNLIKESHQIFQA